MMTLEDYLDNKGVSWTYLEEFEYSKYSVGVSLLDSCNEKYTIVGFIKYTSGYVRYLGDYKGRITSREIAFVDNKFKLNLKELLEDL